jgi:DNA-binding NarL/FixJ family response regulator
MSASNLPKIRVLLADDHAVVRAGIRLFLEHAGDIQVLAEADDGRQAQDLIARYLPDVAVLDIQMPEASGIDVTRWVKSHLPGVGVLVLTAYDEDPYVLAVLQAGANGYVLKTASPAEIIQAIRDVYSGKTVVDASLAQKMVLGMAASKTVRSEAAPVEALTERELEVLALVARGYTNKAIGAQLSISDRTVQGHLAHIYDKLNAASRTEAVMRAISLGLISQGLGSKPA